MNTTETYPGKGGSNLVLTIDTEFQKKIEEIAKKSVEEMTDPAADRVYIVVMNPKMETFLELQGRKRNLMKTFIQRVSKTMLLVPSITHLEWGLL